MTAATLLEKMDIPLVLLDRRRPWNFWRRWMYEDRERAINRHDGMTLVHSGGPFEMADHHKPHPVDQNGGVEAQLARLPVVGVFKLAAIILVVMAPIVTASWALVGVMIENRLAVSRERGFSIADQRYVSAQRYELRHDELVRQLAEYKTRIDSADQQRNEMRLQLQQILMTLEQMNRNQQKEGGVKR